MFSVLTDTTSRQLEQAVALNHQELFFRNAIARGGEIRTTGGLSYTYEGPDHQSMIAFPFLHDDEADGQLDEMMEWYRERPNQGIGCWSLDPPRPADLGDKLLQRGFQDGWRPCWMALDLGQINEAFAPSSQLQIVADNDLSLLEVKNLPYTGHHGAISAGLMRQGQGQEQVQQFVAILKGKIVGHCAVFFTAGSFGVAGLYNVAVVPSARGRGIGKALVTAACQYARDRGYRYAVLNGTGRRMYEQMGFRWVGDGFTWWWFPEKGK